MIHRYRVVNCGRQLGHLKTSRIMTRCHTLQHNTNWGVPACLCTYASLSFNFSSPSLRRRTEEEEKRREEAKRKELEAMRVRQEAEKVRLAAEEARKRALQEEESRRRELDRQRQVEGEVKDKLAREATMQLPIPAEVALQRLREQERRRRAAEAEEEEKRRRQQTAAAVWSSSLSPGRAPPSSHAPSLLQIQQEEQVQAQKQV